MQSIKEYFLKHFEQSFVLLILISAVIINYFIPYKLAFLNFYFIPVLLAAYYLDLRRALLGAFFGILMVCIYAYLFPETFVPGSELLDLAMNIVTWASFLVLTGVVVGGLNEKLKLEVEQVRGLNEDLKGSKDRLETADKELRDYAENLEVNVRERTESLEKSKEAIEDLKKKVEDALYSTMDASVVRLIIEKRLRTEKRKISVLFSDLKGFTHYSEERRAEVVITDLNKFLREMEGVLLEYRAHIDKYIGDGIMAEFGAPIDYERHALLAVLTGLKMQERLAKGNFPWQMRVGIASGEPIIGLIGHKRQTYTAIGDAVNLAERIEETGAPGKVTIDEATYEDVKVFITATRKTLFSYDKFTSPELVKSITEAVEALDKKPDDAELLKTLGYLLVDANDHVQANDYFKRALDLDPKDDKTKVAYADTSMKMAQMEAIAIRGRKTRIRLYEVDGIRNPLEDREKIPKELCDRYCRVTGKLVAYPEDSILPTEALDGCVGHSRGTGFVAYALADALKLSEDEKRDVLEGGYLLDVGKAIVPHHILNRAGSLNKEEYAEVTKHSEESVSILRKLGYRKESMFDMIRSHHEAFNGSGYPQGLAGDKIPIGARILAVADSYDALTSWRPYRDRWDYRAAFSEMEKDTRQGKFDPAVIECLGKILGFQK
ncbi:MAG: HD domain-containing phosphohydrolase [Elusimicrobiota bacterium]